MNSLTSEKNQSSPNKSPKKRGKINIVACDKCKHDKKRCDGNYLTRKACKYCRNHNQECVYSETNFLRISRILNAAAKNAAEDREDNSMQELQKQLTKYENTIIELAYQLENKNEIEQSNVIIEKLYLSLFASPQISNEQTIILKKLCEITNNSTNLNTDDESINEIRNKLLILASNNRTDIEKRRSWEELDKFVKTYNDNLTYNNIPSDDLLTSNIFGFSFPSGTTTPIPSPQFIEKSNISNVSNANMYVTNNHVIPNKKRKFEKTYEPYPSGGHIAIRPSRKENNVMVWHQNDPHEDIPMIAIHAPQNNHSVKSTNSNETFQNSNVQFNNNISSNENFPFSTSNLVLSSHMPYGFDEVGRYSNLTSPTFSSNSDDNLEFPTFFSHPSVASVEDFLGIFPISQ